MQIEQQEFSDSMLITVGEPRIDAAIAIQFKDTVRDMAGDDHARVVLEMSKVEFLDSSGLGALVAAMKQLGPSRQLELASLTPTVEKVFKLTRMDTVFKIHPTAGSAIHELAHAS